MTSFAILALLACGRFLLPGGPSAQPGGWALKTQETERIPHRLTEYQIKAKVPVLGDISTVGTFNIEEDIRTDGDQLDKVFRIFGNSKPELASKGKDYRGELKMTSRFSGNSQGEGDGEDGDEERAVQISSTGFFNKNGQVVAESITFFPDCAISRRENGDEKRVDGQHGCLITVLEYFIDHEVAEGDIREFPFILGGSSYCFKCEVGKAAALAPYGSKVFPVDFTVLDGLRKDSRGMPLVKQKKGSIRIWVSKEGPFKDRILRLKLQYAWYLTLHMDLYKAS
jgi:hypothetical protein